MEVAMSRKIKGSRVKHGFLVHAHGANGEFRASFSVYPTKEGILSAEPIMEHLPGTFDSFESAQAAGNEAALRYVDRLDRGDSTA
jgi:hypothetical protein